MCDSNEQTSSVSGVRVLPLAEADSASTGGKAGGLAQLIRLGLRVPPGFVLAGARPGELPGEVAAAYRRLGGGPVAVRSSAASEDSARASFAGQFESVLDVQGEAALGEAINRCLRSLSAARPTAYAREHGEPGAMNVVVQQMVQPRTAGVLFTADPVAGRPGVVLVDAVPGLGEALVSGRESPDRYELTREGRLMGTELRGAAPLLDAAELRLLVEQALRAEAALGRPLDLEWAIDADGGVHWLQARPITTMTGPALEGGEAALHEFDTPAQADHVYTRANVGEMLPGPVCPLMLTTGVYAVDQGIQRMHVLCGAQPRLLEPLQLIRVFYGHLFFDLSALAEFALAVGGSTPEQVTFAICGRTIPELRVGPPAPAFTRAINGAGFVRYVLGGRRRVDRFERRLRDFQISAGPTAAATYAELDAKLPFLLDAYAMHLQSSASSGLSHGVLQGVLAKGRAPTPEQEALMAGWLQATGGLESAALVGGLEEVRREIERQDGIDRAFVNAPCSEALAWLRSAAAGSAGAAFVRFLARQGHRGVNELSMQQLSWADDPTPLVQSLQAAVASARAAAAPARGDVAAGDGAREPTGLVLRALVAWARASVRQRERSKAMLVQVTDHFRRGYRRLGALLFDEGALPDPELVVFLTHRELGRVSRRGRDAALVEAARRRRSAQLEQRRLEFADLFVGAPRPLGDAQPAAIGEALQGRPVSRGRACGRARVVRSLDEASSLQAGEILVAPVTDVGWSPYFKLIAGLATDVGSAISHGAVLARECGLPAVVNLRVASKLIRTGDLVVLDGDHGTLTRLSQ